MGQRSAIVIGAGIVGLATARALAVRGYAVKVIERSDRAVGASIRNFGMIWPIGQPAGELYERAMISRSIWKQICDEAGLWHESKGSLHLAYDDDEWDVLQELAEIYKERGYDLLNREDTIKKSEAIVESNLRGSLHSPDELVVDPRIAIATIPRWLEEKFGTRFIWGQTVTDICYPAVYLGDELIEADEIYVCSGADFETLYPQLYSNISVTKCKLQMMRLVAQPDGWRIGPSLCGGLSLLHYSSFKAASSLSKLSTRLAGEFADHLKWGIHVMVSQNESGELTVGDSHEYGMTHEPFDRQLINRLILDYLKRFARFRDETVTQTWHGIYPKLTDGRTEFIAEPERGVMVINGLGGAGMTLSFGLCEQVINKSLIGSYA